MASSWNITKTDTRRARITVALPRAVRANTEEPWVVGRPSAKGWMPDTPRSPTARAVARPIGHHQRRIPARASPAPKVTANSIHAGSMISSATMEAANAAAAPLGRSRRSPCPTCMAASPVIPTAKLALARR